MWSDRPDSRVPYPVAGLPKGGAPIAMAPEIILQQPGSGQFLCYEKNDEWAAGIVVHELLSTAAPSAVGFVPHRPFANFDHPETYADASYQETDRPGTLPLLRETVRELLRLDPATRLSALDAYRLFDSAVGQAKEAAAAAAAAAEAARLEAEAEAAARAAQAAAQATARKRRRERATAAAVAAKQEANRAAAAARAEAEAARRREQEVARLAAKEEAEARVQIAEAEVAMRARRRQQAAAGCRAAGCRAAGCRGSSASYRG
eukprot:SAG22_NODE_779_length_7272_cov_146.237418_4_plen_262_part_00